MRVRVCGEHCRNYYPVHLGQKGAYGSDFCFTGGFVPAEAGGDDIPHLFENG